MQPKGDLGLAYLGFQHPAGSEQRTTFPGLGPGLRQGQLRVQVQELELGQPSAWEQRTQELAAEGPDWLGPGVQARAGTMTTAWPAPLGVQRTLLRQGELLLGLGQLLQTERAKAEMEP